jgi:hypothetical protein
MGTRRIRSSPTVSHPSASHSGTRSSLILHRRCAYRRETREVGRRRGQKHTHTHPARAQRKPQSLDRQVDGQSETPRTAGGREDTPSRVVNKAASETTDRRPQDRAHTIIAQAQAQEAGNNDSVRRCNSPLPPSLPPPAQNPIYLRTQSAASESPRGRTTETGSCGRAHAR